jgi:hypothetical protein
MEAADGRSRTDFPGLVRRLIFDAPGLRVNSAASGHPWRRRAAGLAIAGKSENAGLCSIEQFRALATASVAP